MKYVYTAVFTAVDDGYSVCIPDLPGCITAEIDASDAITMIEDAGAMWLWDAENNAEPFLHPHRLNKSTLRRGRSKLWCCWIPMRTAAPMTTAL